MPEAGWTPEEIYLLADRGYAFYRQGRYEEAAVIFDGLVALDPTNTYCRTAMATVCLCLGDAERAAGELTAVLEQNPADHEARARRCEAYCDLRHWDEARRDLAILQRNGEQNHARRLAWRLQASRVATS
jgi:tetratricopeptide (TPR) repeat protein